MEFNMNRAAEAAVLLSHNEQVAKMDSDKPGALCQLNAWHFVWHFVGIYRAC
jgi:hypothetical protein